MGDLEITVERLKAMTVARFHALGQEPETAAWNKLVAWAKPRGYLESGSGRRIFGFNNPDPSVGSPEYGYEFWIQIDPGTAIHNEEIVIEEFPGALYAKRPFRGNSPMELPGAWEKFARWREASNHSPGRHQWLEEHSPAGRVLAMLLPIGDED